MNVQLADKGARSRSENTGRSISWNTFHGVPRARGCGAECLCSVAGRASRPSGANRSTPQCCAPPQKLVLFDLPLSHKTSICSIVLEQRGVIILLHQVADATSVTPRDPYFKTHYCTDFHELRLHLN